MIGEAVDSPGTVLFKTASGETNAVGPKCTRQHVTSIPSVGGPFELKGHRLAAVDPFTRLLGKAIFHAQASLSKR